MANPFRTLTDEEWEEVALLPESVETALRASPTAALQIVGDGGRGKTSALHALTGQAKRTGITVAYEYLPEGTDRFATCLDNIGLFCLDEAQRLSANECERLAVENVRSGTRLVLGTHSDFAPLLRRYRLPYVTVRLAGFDSSYLASVWQRRLRYFARPDATTPATLSPQAILVLRQRFGDDLRTAERFLYGFFQNRVRSTATITGDDLLRE